MSQEIACSPKTAVFTPGIEIITPLASRVLFWHPRFLRDTAALHFVPFLFWLTDVLRPKSIVHLGLGSGVAYFASCQAVDKLNLDARCYGYNPKISKKIQSYNAENYTDFSETSARDPQKAARNFPDGSVDLLHVSIDMKVEKLEVVLHRWLPKMSQGGIALLTGEAASLQSGKLAELVEMTQKAYPWFKIEVGNGMLVLMCGNDLDDRLVQLSELRVGAPGYGAIHQVFNRLGATVVSEFRARASAGKIKKLERSLRKSQRNLAAALDGSTKDETQVHPNQKVFDNTGVKIDASSAELEAQNAKISLLAKTLTKRLEALAIEFAQSEGNNKSLEASLNVSNAKLDETENEKNTLSSQIEHLNKRLSGWDRDLETLTETLETQAILATDQAEQSFAKYDSRLRSQTIAIAQDRDVLQNVYQERDAALQHNIEMAQAIDEMLKSTSWRLTSPVRKLANTVRGKA